MSAGPTAWLGGALLLFASLYFGLGWGLVLFQFPGALQATRPGGFAERFGRPVRTAVTFFSVWSVLMVVGGIVLTVAEWDQGGYRWGPLVYTVATVVATTFTVVLILPVNRALYADVPDEATVPLPPATLDQPQHHPYPDLDRRVVGHRPLVRGAGQGCPHMIGLVRWTWSG